MSPPSRSQSHESIESTGLGPAGKYQGNLPPPSPNAQVEQTTVRTSFSYLEPEGGQGPRSALYNTIALLIFCDQHKKIALIYNDRCKAHWLPFIAVESNKKWTDATADCLSLLFAKEDPEMDARLMANISSKLTACIHIQRIQLPSSQKFITRLVQLVVLDNSKQITFKCCQDNTKRIVWVNVEDVLQGRMPAMWGPEVTNMMAQSVTMHLQEISEYGLDQAFYYLPKGRLPRNAEEEMLLSLDIDMNKIEKMYIHFLEHCFPCSAMTFTSFCKYAEEYIHGFATREATAALFHAMNFHEKGQLGFQEFLLGIISIEPACQTNESRLKFIYRFYSPGGMNGMTPPEFGQLLADTRSGVTLEQFGGVFASERARLTWADFNSLVKKYNLPWDGLCRATVSTIETMLQFFEARKKLKSKKGGKSTQSGGGKNVCLGCSYKKYKYGAHCVRFDVHGKCVEPQNILEFEEDVEDRSDTAIFKYSQEFMFGTVGQTFLDMLRDYGATKGIDKSIGFLTGADTELLSNYVCPNLCQNVIGLLDAQEKLIKINSPAYVIGDIRGNFDDLLKMERLLWPSVPILSSNYIFLGNYVNGSWSVESVLFLLALKVCCPNKFFLLRGQCEVRANQRTSFLQECVTKYGQQHGTFVWNQLNDVFDRLTLMVVVDEAILCANSGVPSAPINIEAAYRLAKEVKEPLVCPITKDFINNVAATDEVIIEFLNRNKLSHLIRSNQTLPKGYTISAQERCLTITSSRQAHARTDPCIAYIDRPKIRIVKFENAAAAASPVKLDKKSYFS